MSKTVLIVDDEPGILSTLAGVFSDEGFETECTQSGEEALQIYKERQPDVVFLDIWLPDRDGLETLQSLLEIDPAAAVVMMSGHGTTTTAVKAIKMGALDYLEKPLSYAQAVEGAQAALEYRLEGNSLANLDRIKDRKESQHSFSAPPDLSLLVETETPQRSIREGTVVYGLGLHSGRRTGMAIQPLPVNSGIHFVTVPNSRHIPAHVDHVADTDYATTLSGGDDIKTVEHFLSALHAYGVTNLLVKVHGEIPVLDGSALEFCRTLEEAGVVDQSAPRQEIVIDRVYEIGEDGKKSLRIEPYDGFSVSYRLDYPAPIGEQYFEFELSGTEPYKREVAPARTFGFMRDLAMMNELGLGSGGRLDNFILVGEDNVINTELRFSDEFARHKALDVIGDLYLLGYPIRGNVTADRTGHRDNVAILREILKAEAAR